MKKILILTLFITLVGCESQQKNTPPKSIKSIKIGNLEVALTDLGRFTWLDASEECAKLGDGWRLPTKDELNVLYQNKDKIGGFEIGYYWSSTEYNDNDACNQFFSGGEQSYGPKGYNNPVRAVRSL
jgi:hypothetical protein